MAPPLPDEGEGPPPPPGENDANATAFRDIRGRERAPSGGWWLRSKPINRPLRVQTPDDPRPRWVVVAVGLSHCSVGPGTLLLTLTYLFCVLVLPFHTLSYNTPHFQTMQLSRDGTASRNGTADTASTGHDLASGTCALIKFIKLQREVSTHIVILSHHCNVYAI